jgi:hypothetical protein
MKPLKYALLSLALFTSAAIAAPPAKGYQPEGLRTLLQHSTELAREGRRPLVIFDLDDTLINTRERNLRILVDFAATIQDSQPSAATLIRTLDASQIQYLLADTLKIVGVTDAQILQKATAFWLSKFFTNEYCAKDTENPGAAFYLDLLARAGAKIVYLTGRDEPRMGEGTRTSLSRNRFPGPAGDALLLLKPDKDIDDLKFKESQYAAIAMMGEVIGVFENEPANINSMADAFPMAQAIFLDTIHSPKPDMPEGRVEWVQNFYLP